jgi:hypothetical protein
MLSSFTKILIPLNPGFKFSNQQTGVNSGLIPVAGARVPFPGKYQETPFLNGVPVKLIDFTTN